MSECLNVKLPNIQLDKLKSAIKNETAITLRLGSNMIGKFNDESTFPHNLLSTDRNLSKHHKAFANN